MTWPITIGGRTWTRADFADFGYVQNLSLLLHGAAADFAAKIAQAGGHATAAAASALSADRSAVTAAGSAAAVEAAAGVVAGYAATATARAAAAGEHATAASGFAGDAAGSAGVAGDHAVAALTSAGAAAGSADTAGDHAAAALTSAGDATGSAGVAADHAMSASVASLAAAGSASDAADHQTRAAHWADLVEQAAAAAVWAPGDIKLSAVVTAPVGWLACDGAAMDRAVYAALFAAIGTVYGEGDGATTFNLPDLRGRVPVGVGDGVGDGGDPLVSVAPGQRFGQPQVELAVPLLEHSHGAALEVMARAVIATSGTSAGKSFTPSQNSVFIQPTLPNANLYTSGINSLAPPGHPTPDLTIGPDDAVKGTATGEVMAAGITDATITVPLQPPSIGLVYLIKM